MSVIQLRRYQRKGNYQAADADLDAVAASGVAAAWTAYTPTVNSTAGAITATVSAAYLRMGKLCFVQAAIAISASPGGFLNMSLPTNLNRLGAWAARESAVTGHEFTAMTGGADWVTFFRYDNTASAVAGYNISTSGFYETV